MRSNAVGVKKADALVPIGRLLALAAAVIALTAQSPSDPAWLPSDAEIAHLERIAADTSLWPPGPHTMIAVHDAKEMPAFDKLVYYEGRESTPPGSWLHIENVLFIHVNRADEYSDEAQHKLHDARLLAAMDSGAAGPEWKRRYDDLAALDDRLPPAVADRYQHRHLALALIDARIEAMATPAPTPDPRIEAVAATISDADVEALLVAWYREAMQIVVQPGPVPPGHVYAYAGMNAAGKPTVNVDAALAKQPQRDRTRVATMQTDIIFAQLAAAADSGAAGPALQRRYADLPDKMQFGPAVARATELASKRMREKTKADMAWIHASIPLGSTRDTVAKLLKTRGLAFAAANQTVVRFSLGIIFGCDDETATDFTFDPNGALTTMTDEPESRSCL